MLQIILRKTDEFYACKNRWWLPLVCGLLYAFAHPPFSAFLHPVFAAMPIFAPLSLVPMFYFATRKPRRRALLHTYLYCVAMMLGQNYWIGFVTADGLWALILIGVALIALVFGIYYFAAAMAFRFLAKRLPKMCAIVFPAVWVLVEYSRTLTDLAFPWSFAGYCASGFLPLAQFASFTGVWGLSFLIVTGNVMIWEYLRAVKNREPIQQKRTALGVWAALTAGIIIWGIVRLSVAPSPNITSGDKSIKHARAALMQSYMDQFNWTRASLDTAVTISDSMIRAAAKEDPDVMIFPESALLCYLDKRPDIKQKVNKWTEETKTPIVVGALHWEYAQKGEGTRSNNSGEEYDVYNTAFLAKDGKLTPYHKMALVPFSEAMPFQAQIPILSRTNLGGAGFKRGTEETIFRLTDRLSGAPFICYEIIFPNLVRRRLTESTDMIINVTNDGWFGRSSGPYQHAAMSQMRSIENGITLARAANSGISMFVDPYGRVIAKTGLYTREILVRDVPVYRVMTFYARFGDWFVSLCALVVVIGIIACFIKGRRLGEITNPLLIKEQNLAAANG